MPGCTSAHCPDCRSGGQSYLGCFSGTAAVDCFPCPPPCGTLDETACNARGDCQADYCNGCRGRTFVGCGFPGTDFACPAGEPACPVPLPCADVADQLSCDARSDCHSVFGGTPTNTFSRCADGGKANCKGPLVPGSAVCTVPSPVCQTPEIVVSYTNECYEGCVRRTECAP
jgi:hypothetical protein